MLSTTSHQPLAVSLPSEDLVAASSDEPPDRVSYSLPRPIFMHGQNVTSRTSSTLEPLTSPTVSYSPYMADSTGGSASDHEHELDSPSSLSSWNSWAGGRRGDLADVEDLELDGMLGGEPELETVSERDEESSGFYSGSDRVGLDSDDDVRHNKLDVLGLGLDSNIAPRRKNIRVGGHFNEISHNHHVHHASNQHHYHHPSTFTSHAPPSFPHFSPKAGGHGLSHASRHTLRVPPNLAARRRKGRIAELAEEGAGEAINTTVMPSKASAKRKDKELGKSEDREAAEQEDQERSLTETETDHEDTGAPDLSPSTPTLQSSSHSWNDFEFIGPPPLPVRCVSPSETVPVVPSPLCVCLNAEEQNVNEEKVVPTSDTVTLLEEKTSQVSHQYSAQPSSPSSPSSTSGKSFQSFPATVSTPSTSPPTSPQLTRRSSRNRRSSSPGRTKPKVPLRPCFRRRASAQVGVLKNIESSSECDSETSSARGRIKVRFSDAPPTEVRTHSPVDYDRKACPISNRLSTSDVEELRELKMEMGLLEAKWAAVAACKTESGAEEEEGSETEHTSSNLLSPSYATSSQRKRADSISSSAPTQFCKNRLFARDSSISPADHLRIEREKERERACRLAGIGTGIGFRYSGGGSSTRQLHHGGSKTPGACSSSSIISRFGLSKPPPPLPGAKYGYEGGTSLHRPSSAPPVQSSATTIGDLFGNRDRQMNFNVETDEQDEFRGRSMDKNIPRDANSSTSTDGTETGGSTPSTPASIPELKHTSPSPDSSPDRSRSSSSPPLYQQVEKITRPGILPYQPPYSTSSRPVSFSSSTCGYDSPASEFYESGSEYDLIG